MKLSSPLLLLMANGTGNQLDPSNWLKFKASFLYGGYREQDQPEWMISKGGRYCSSATWDAIREKQDLVDCYQLVSFPLAIPSPTHSFPFAGHQECSDY